MRSLVLLLLALVACASDRTATGKDSSAREQSSSAATVRAAATSIALQPAAAPTRLEYPPSRRSDAGDTLHGIRVPDPYRWLEEEKSPEVQAWMEAQDAFARSRLRGLPGRDIIARRLSELLYVDALGAPRHRGQRYFYSRRHASKEKAVVYVKEGRRGRGRVLLDPNTWTKDGSDALGGWWPSWDGKVVAYTVHHNNSD